MHSYRSLIFYVAAVVVLSVAYFASPMSRETVWQLFPGTEAMAQANPLVAALVFLVASTVFAFLAFPSMPMIYMAAGFYMDGFGGAATVLLGSALGGLSAFLFYRKHIRRPIAPLIQRSVRSIWLTLIGLRLSPLVPAPLVNFFAAVFDVSPLQYLTTSLLGSAPLVLFYWQIGQQGHRIPVRRNSSLAAIFRILGHFSLKHAVERDGPLAVGAERVQAAKRLIQIKDASVTASLQAVILIRPLTLIFADSAIPLVFRYHSLISSF